MVLCLLALPVFLVLGIFSLKYRMLARDALHCLFRTITLRKCQSGLDDRIRSQITGHLLRFSPKIASLVYRHYKLLSWIVLLLFVFSTYETAKSAYNYTLYGNCYGPEETGFCLLDPSGGGISDADIDVQKEVVVPSVEQDDPFLGSKDATLTVIEFGCYACPYTKKAEPIVKQLLEHYNGAINVQFKTFVIPRHGLSYPAALAANCAAEQGKYEPYHNRLFEMQENLMNSSFNTIAEELKLNIQEFDKCFGEEKFKEEIQADTLMGAAAGVIGTPTFFVNERKIVGPKPFKTFKKLIDEELKNV